ncbi:MAG: site-2 protease family protein [Chloroflexi bacterium]|nr:site-2 protease family protein [Chloroflexota bacterium]
MPGSFLIARVIGIDIRVHFSWFLIFGLILFTYSDPNGGLFSQVRPTWSDQKLVIVAGIYAVLFFLSIVAHELAHAAVARAFRMPVSSITLFLLGGVANLAKEPPSARAEFLMAIAGPATSLVIGGVGLGIAQVADEVVLRQAALDPVGVVAFYLGLTNLLLAGFNMIPGYPLDGGRVLRSVVWGIVRERTRATRVAARGGQVVAGLLVLVGAWRVFVLDETFGGLWTALIAYFLYNAASASLQQERVAGMVAGVEVGPLMSRQFVAVPRNMSIAELVDGHMLPNNARAVAVVDAGRLRGIVSVADLRKVPQAEWPVTGVQTVMTPASAIPSLSPTSRLMTAIERFGSTDLPLLPVVEDEVIVGVLDRESVLSYMRMREVLGHRKP